ncbi:unnamed protein product, partial [Mesorhabditis spiculigera]
MYSVEDWTSWCNEKYRCTRCHNNDNPVDDMLMKRREFENDTGRTLGEVELEAFRENVPRLINCIKCYQKYHYFNNEPENTWIALEDAEILVHSYAIQRYVDTIITPLSTLLTDAFMPKIDAASVKIDNLLSSIRETNNCAEYQIIDNGEVEPEMSSIDTKIEPDCYELLASEKLTEMIDKMRNGIDVTVDEREKWVKKAIERNMIPAELTSENEFMLQIGRMMNILHSPIFRAVLSKTRCWLSLEKSQEYPSEMAVYECAGVWKEQTFAGDYRWEYGTNCSSFVIRSIQKLLNGGTLRGQGSDIHRGPWHFPFIGEKQRAFEEKYNVRVVLITYKGYWSTSRYLRIFPCNKPDSVLRFSYKSTRSFNISMGYPSNFEKYEQMELDIIGKDETMKVTSEKMNESTYKRTMEPDEEGGKALVWTANYRPSFDDINCFDCLKGPLPDMSYCSEFHEMC